MLIFLIILINSLIVVVRIWISKKTWWYCNKWLLLLLILCVWLLLFFKLSIVFRYRRMKIISILTCNLWRSYNILSQYFSSRTACILWWSWWYILLLLMWLLGSHLLVYNYFILATAAWQIDILFKVLSITNVLSCRDLLRWRRSTNGSRSTHIWVWRNLK